MERDLNHLKRAVFLRPFVSPLAKQWSIGTSTPFQGRRCGFDPSSGNWKPICQGMAKTKSEACCVTQEKGTKKGCGRQSPSLAWDSYLRAPGRQAFPPGIQAPTDESGKVAPQESCGFHCPRSPRASPGDSGLSSQAVSPTRAPATATTDPLGLPAVSTDHLRTMPASHLISVLGPLPGETHRAGCKRLEVNIPGSNLQPTRSVPW